MTVQTSTFPDMRQPPVASHPILAIVVPCYCEVEVLPYCVANLTDTLNQLIGKKLIAQQSFILFVNDGSTDDTWAMMCGLTTQFPGRIAALNLSTNVGHQKALFAGLERGVEEADVLVSIDVDMQDDTSVIESMVKKYLKGADIVYGIRRRRKSDGWFKRNSAKSFYQLMKLLGVRSMYNHADFRLMSHRAVKELMRYGESNLYLRGLIPLLGFNQEKVYYDRRQRIAGNTKYPLRKMLAFAADGITSFSIRPVRLVLLVGAIFMFMALTIGIYVALRHFTGHTTTGWSSLVLSIWFCSGLILVALGIVGEYIGKIYKEVKHRPRYHTESYIRLTPSDTD